MQEANRNSSIKKWKHIAMILTGDPKNISFDGGKIKETRESNGTTIVDYEELFGECGYCDEYKIKTEEDEEDEIECEGNFSYTNTPCEPCPLYKENYCKNYFAATLGEKVPTFWRIALLLRAGEWTRALEESKDMLNRIEQKEPDPRELEAAQERTDLIMDRADDDKDARDSEELPGEDENHV